ncbi:hypothetical protein [Streptomyces sp. NBC_00691]|uniref:hypothetical protein n=1 Tax=Streptomyces sp. NBC_00691 TaxID=2903671 RepID=UPI002E2FEEFC|nr:hypothetical protein [Streptomyces sp. NBC_00691]
MAVETLVLDDDCEAITGWRRTAPAHARVRRPRRGRRRSASAPSSASRRTTPDTAP